MGAAGGVGTTTVASHLATALMQQQRSALCFDFCPTNVLRLHFGAALDEDDGFAAALMGDRDWRDTCYSGASGVQFVPFGVLKNDGVLDQLSQRFGDQPTWFGNVLDELDLDMNTIVICDCPRWPFALRDQVLAAADLRIVVCLPDPLSLMGATRFARQTHGESGSRHGMILLNRFDAARALDRDVQLLLRRQHGHLTVPVTIHEDEYVREALAHKQTIFDYAPTSQVALEYAALATWTTARSGLLNGSHG
jgi:cellulose synthase operon protein YhjQ